ncbi:MAG: hypothetical protein ACOYOS_10870 [Syntrophales bacterium]
MEEGFIENRATSVPFAGILADLLTTNLTQRPEKRAVHDNMSGAVAIELVDIETVVTLLFASGKLRIEEGIVGRPEIVIRTTSDLVMDLNALRIVGGLPWYFDEAGRRVLAHLVSGRLKISGLFTQPVLLTQLTKIMSVM